MNNLFDINKHIGICAVHANYEGIRKSFSKSTESNTYNEELKNGKEIESIVDKFDSIKIINNTNNEEKQTNVVFTTNTGNIHNSLLDFSNYEPDKFRINMGSGFLITIMGERFVITCSHIMIKSAVKYTAIFDINLHAESFDMEVYFRIPEIDMVIMKFADIEDRLAIYKNISTKSKLSHVPDLMESYNVSYIRDYQNNLDIEKQNQILTAVHVISNDINTENQIKYDTIDLPTKLDRVHSTLVTSMIETIPNISIPISGLDIFTDIETKYQKKIEDIFNDEKDITSKIAINKVMKKLKGLSGSIITSQDTKNINSKNICLGMIVTFSLSTVNSTETKLKNEGSIKSIPMDVILTVVNNCIRKRNVNLMGVQIDYNGCIAEENEKEFYAAIVRNPSSRYINGKKDFWFNPEDLILGIDQMDIKLNGSELVLNTKKYGNKLPLNAYMFYKGNEELGSDISITLSKVYDKINKKINFNIKPIPYNNMHITRIYHQKEILWNGYLFLELSEELIRFYKFIGIDLLMGDDINEESMNGEKIVILFNYNKVLSSDLNSRYMNLVEYTNMPCKIIKNTKPVYFFYRLERVSNRMICNIEELGKTIKDIDKSGQKKITLVLKNKVFGNQIKLIL
jgi:hypothetical protein